MIIAPILRLIKGSPRTFTEDDANFTNLYNPLLMVPQRVWQSYAGWVRSSSNTAADAVFNTLVSVTIPADTMDANSRLVIVADWSYLSSASTKSMQTDFGGALAGISTATTSNGFKAMVDIQNLNSLATQGVHNAHTFGSAGTRISGSVDTSNDAVIDLKCKWGAAIASETITLVGYSIICYPGT